MDELSVGPSKGDWTKWTKSHWTQYDPGMRQVNIHEAKTHFSELIAAVERGEEIVIARRGRIVARIQQAEREVESKPMPRFGFLKGKIRVDPSFYEPMTSDEFQEWLEPLEGLEELSPDAATARNRRPA